LRGEEEIDRYWDSLFAAPEAEQCGWLKDQFGVSWQVRSERLGRDHDKRRPGQDQTA
jgi:predicted 3-demethylubiquinone-9 3-methyltransferase (glyoxalase superfamily)